MKHQQRALHKIEREYFGLPDMLWKLRIEQFFREFEQMLSKVEGGELFYCLARLRR